VKTGGQPALAFASKRGPHISAEKREKVSGKREKKREEKRRRKRRTIRKGGGIVSQNVGREEGASERDATHLKLWREKDWAASCRRRRVRGEVGKVGNCRARENDLENFHATQSQPWEFTQTVTHLPRPFPPSVLYSTVATQVRFSFHFSFPLTVPPLYRYRNPLSLAIREGGCPLFFSRRRPFPLINAWGDAAAAW
jgi:hypothetical protein